MIVKRREVLTGRGAARPADGVTLLPFVSLFVTALHPSGTYPAGSVLAEPTRSGATSPTPSGAAGMGQLLRSSALIVLGVVPLSVLSARWPVSPSATCGCRATGPVSCSSSSGLTLPFEGMITPLYYQVRDMGLLNTRWAIILPLIGLFMPFSVLWMRAHFVNMPDELSEAARIDGATTWQLFWRVHVPLAKPALSSLAILLFLWTWNQFLLAIVLVDDPAKRTMAGALGAFQGQWGTDIPLLCAGSLLILAPTLIVFLIFQRRFVSALLQGSLKG